MGTKALAIIWRQMAECIVYHETIVGRSFCEKDTFIYIWGEAKGNGTTGDHQCDSKTSAERDGGTNFWAAKDHGKYHADSYSQTYSRSTLPTTYWGSCAC
mmetsp:Transcript_54684/g.79772  ORF Transcript_54684/g.79772 Transcript_54684/m.79772 type:complete len:100 (-) Transcript_54684:432-731(-)